MAQRRMFSPDIVESDAFLDMPTSSQVLYFHLGMYADDDGFVNPKRIMRMVGVQDDDLKVLISKRFVLPFDNGVVVIKHWKINNLVRKDWYKETQYLEQKKLLYIKDNGVYTDNPSHKILVNENVPSSLTNRQHRLGKVRLGKDTKYIASEDAQLLAVKKNTPSQDAENFFSGGAYYKILLSDFSANNDPRVIEEEFKKFALYWTEPNKSGTKVRWQQQPTFEVKRRLYTWMSRKNEQKISKGKVINGL